MKKILIISIFLFFIKVLEVKAIEETIITCKNETCLNSSNLPIFLEDNIYPGFLINKKIKVVNKTDLSCNLNLKIKKENDFDNKLAEKISMKINNKNYSLNKIIGNFIYLGKIPKDNFKFYDLSYAFDKQSGNEFKNKKINFGMDFNFECKDKEQIINNDQRVLGIKTKWQTVNTNWYFLLILISIIGFTLLISKYCRIILKKGE